MATASPIPDVSEALARVESLLAGSPGPKVPDRLDAACIRWVCLVPVWTPTLATRCGMPGWSSASDLDVLEAWRDDGLIEAMLTPLAIDDTGQVTPAQHLFWVPRNVRPAWLARIVAEDGRDRLAALARDIAARILAEPRDQHMPTATWRWALVASHATSAPADLRQAFERELGQALTQERPDEAWMWIEALQRVAEVVPGEATTLHQRAVRRLALFDRQRNDRAMLRDYLPRPALFDAYRTLLVGSDDLWAMHYLGGGGVGKTMLMRALTSGAAEHLPPGFEVPPTITARIDFDHINPDYPARRPGLLFAHLAEELRLKDDSLRASENFGLLFNKIALLHERSSAETTPAADIEEMLDVFGWACEAVAAPRNARVVLLLDTCEELDRLGPDGALPQSVERTFHLLEQLHERLPSLRVVLCGRRPLAGSYAEGESVPSHLPPRPWLRLHRVFAFSEDEARVYLERAAVPARLVAPVLARSLAAASSATLGLPAADAAPRYSPFSLSVYSAWIAKQRDVDPDRVLEDRIDHFVHIRILDRIRNEDVRRLLPHVALLGRFDDVMLRACVDVRSEVADAVLREVGAQEWVDRQAGGYYAVEPELRARLLRYFEQESARELADARRRVLPALWTLLDAGAVDQVPDQAVVQSLLQMVQGDRAAMLRAWRILDNRVVRGAQAAWGMRVFGRLLADEAALGAQTVDRGAWGACVTTYAECVMHEQGVGDTSDLWRNAWDAAQDLDEPLERAIVLVRAASGGLATAANALGSEMAFDMWALRLCNLLTDRATSITSPPHVAPIIAALMACADAVERSPDPLAPAPPLLERMAVAVSEVRHAPARALALVCVARFAARRQDADLSRKRFSDALQTMAESHDRSVLPCLQWPLRLEPSAWVALESLRGLAGLEPVEETLARFPVVPPVRSEIMANRLESLRLRLTAAVGVPAPLPPSPTGVTSAIGPGDVAAPDTYGHVAVQPRAVAVALDHVEGGRPAEGLRLLAELTSVATSARNTSVATMAERARVEAITRMRLAESAGLSRQLMAGARSLPLEERQRMRAFVPIADGSATIALAGAPTRPLSEGGEEDVAVSRAQGHALWRAMRAFDSRTREALGRTGRDMLLPLKIDGAGEWARASVALDLVECSELDPDAPTGEQGLTPVSPEDWWSRHPAQPELALRIWMRSAALGVAPGGPTSVLVRRVGVRRAATVAMEEGELLALRLPAQALRLLALALTWYEDAHDLFGVWQLTTLLALTRVRAGVPRDSIDLSALRAAHEPLVGKGGDRGTPGLPPWSWVEGVPQLPLADTPGLTEWAPWLHRVIALHHWVVGGVRPEVLFSTPDWLPIELRDWPSDAAGAGSSPTADTRVTADARRYMPPPAVPGPRETQLPALPPAPSAFDGAGVAEERGASPRSIPTQLWVWAALGMAALLALLWLGWSATAPMPPAAPSIVASTRGAGAPAPQASRPPDVPASRPDEPSGNTGESSLSPPPLAVGGRSVVPALLAVALIGLAAAAAWFLLRRRTAPIVRADPGVPAWVARVTTVGTDVSTGRVSALDVSVALIDDRGTQVAVAPLRVRRTDAFSGLDALRQPPNGTLLSAPLPTQPPLERVWLDLGLPAVWPCWEALLWSGVATDARLWPTVVRTLHASRPPRLGNTPVGAPWPVATVAATAGDDRQASYAWEPALRAGRVSVASITAEAVREGTPMPGIRLVHVTAQPVETPHGLFFEVSGGENLQVQESLESLAVDRGILFDASQISHTFPDMTCALLQPPRRPALDLTPAGREACAGLRIIAASLAEHGVPLVIVLPPLDGELSAHVVRLLGRRVPHLRDGAALDPHEFTMRARDVVFSHAQRLLARDASLELALQVTVYALNANAGTRAAQVM